MYRDQLDFLASPHLAKRNDSFVYINVKKGASPPPLVYVAPPASCFAPPVPPPPFSHLFKKRRSEGASRWMSGSRFGSSHLSPEKKYRKFEEMESFQRNLEEMEMRIFGRKIEQEMTQRFSRDFNEIGKFHLNLVSEFERMQDASQWMEDSIGAEDSPRFGSARRTLSGRKSPHSGRDSGRSTFCPRNATSRKSTFLNDFEIQNNFSGFSHPVYTFKPSHFKKVKSSMHIRLPERVSKSDSNNDLTRNELENSLIRPRVVKRPSAELYGSRRTVGAPELTERKSTFGRLNLPSRSNEAVLAPTESRAPFGRFQPFPAQKGFSEIDGVSRMDPRVDPRKNVFYDCNKRNEMICGQRPRDEPKSENHAGKGGVAKQIYKIMKNMSKIIYDRTLRRDQARLRRDIENCLEGVDVRMNHLIGLKKLLSKFMKEEPVTEHDLDLSNLEVLLFCLFLVKKRYLDLEALQWTPEVINQFREREMLKRSEQNYKVVLKRAFKTLIATFNAENSILGGSEKEFYEHYFGDVAREFGLSIDLFKPQQIFNEIKRQGQARKFEKRKSKKEFASMLKRSTAFMELLQKYLQDRLVINGKKEGIFRDCMKELDRKLPLMIFNWQKRLGNERNFKGEFVKFLVETLVNDKVKLPWSAAEVRRGISSVLALFRKA